MNTDTPNLKARPFYGEFAWAYDLLIDRPVRKESATIATWLTERGVLPGARILDAGCGTGRYATELGRRGYTVQGIDSSDESLAVARRSLDDQCRNVSFASGSILNLPQLEYDGVLCRGVLNDLVDPGDRPSVFQGFHHALRPNGTLIFDVREWDATVQRTSREPVFKKRVATDRGNLTFASVTALEAKTRRLRIAECHTLERDDEERSSSYVFVMQCWTREELESWLPQAGFGKFEYFGGYDAGLSPGATDRLVVVAQL
jgi:SAM-dependent methyltransferase